MTSEPVELEHNCPQCGYAGMVTVPSHLLTPVGVDHYADAQEAVVGRGLLDSEEAGLAQAHAMLAIADAIKALTAAVQGRGLE